MTLKDTELGRAIGRIEANIVTLGREMGDVKRDIKEICDKDNQRDLEAQSMHNTLSNRLDSHEKKAHVYNINGESVQDRIKRKAPDYAIYSTVIGLVGVIIKVLMEGGLA